MQAPDAAVPVMAAGGQVQAMDTLFGKTQKLAEDLDTEMIAKDAVTKEKWLVQLLMQLGYTS